MKTFTTTVKQQIESKTNWMSLGSMLYIIDYSKFLSGLESETEAENNAYTYWKTKSGIKFQDERSRLAYVNNEFILAEA